MTERYDTRLDRIHRHWPLGVLAVIVVGTLLDFSMQNVTLLFASLAMFGALWMVLQRRGVTISGEGLEERGWITTVRVRWDEIGGYQRTAGDQLDWKTNGPLDVLAWPLVQLFMYVLVRPVRWLLRRTLYGRQPSQFFEAGLVIVDRSGTTRFSIDNDERYERKLETIDRIVAELAARGIAERTAAAV